MALTYLSGYLGMDEISAPIRSAAATRNREQFMTRRAAMQARRMAKIEAAKARRALIIARNKITQANEATQTAAVSGDEFGRAKKGAARRAERQEAKQQRQEARQAQKAAKKQVQTARRAAVQAKRAANKAAAQARRTARTTQRQAAKQTRQVAKQTRKAAVRTQRAATRAVPMPRRTRALPEAPMEAPMEAQEDFMEEPMEEPMDAAEEPEYEEMEAEEVEPDYEAEEIGYNYLGLDEIGARRGKEKRQAKRAARKTKRAAKKDKRGGSVVKKIAAAPMRAAFLLLIKTNALKMRTKLRAAWIKDKNAVNTRIVKRFGFKLDNFLRELNRKESQKLSGYFGEPVSISAAIISATPVITAALALFKNLNVPTQDIEKDLAQAKEQEQGSGGGFKLSTPLLLGGAALAAVALFASSKK